jgi:excisionase family DNA binding protein
MSIMTIDELAQYLRVHKKTIYRLLRQRAIPAMRVGRQWRFETTAIDDWLKHRSMAKKAKILVVDDDDLIRMLFQEILNDLGHTAALARDGNQALELMKQSDFDLVFLDLLLPGMDGAELLKKLRALKPRMPVIIITGHPDSDIMSRALVEGPFGVMRKPFSQDDITTALASFLPNMRPASTESMVGPGDE